MTVKIYVPRDAAALSLGAEKVAKAITQEIVARGLDAVVVRNGSRGMFWLEPLVEVELSGKRIDGGRGACALSWGGRGPTVPERPDPSHFCPLRHHRSTVA